MHIPCGEKLIKSPPAQQKKKKKKGLAESEVTSSETIASKSTLASYIFICLLESITAIFIPLNKTQNFINHHLIKTGSNQLNQI